MGQWGAWIVRTNIADFEHKLKTESDAEKRRILEKLLAAEREKLEQLRDAD